MEMKVNVSQELRQPGKVGRRQLLAELGRQEYLGRELAFNAPLQVEAECVYDGEGFSVRGSAVTGLDSHCALCGRPFKEALTFRFDERFVLNPGEDEDCYGYKGEELDLEKMLLDNLFLNMPAYSRCREDCQGLCPVCGLDLNTGQCSCRREEEEKENPFAALEQLLDQDKEV